MCHMNDLDAALVCYARTQGCDMGFALCEHHGKLMQATADKHDGVAPSGTTGWRVRYLELVRIHHPESTWQVYGDTVLFCKQFPYTHAW